MHLPGEDNICLMRTHEELVKYPSADDDTYVTVVETLVENLLRTVLAGTRNEGRRDLLVRNFPAFALEAAPAASRSELDNIVRSSSVEDGVPFSQQDQRL